MKVNYGAKTKAIPNKSQRIIYSCWFGSQRWLYNKGLEEKENYFQIFKKYLSYEEQALSLKILKYQNPWLTKVPSQSLQQTLLHLDNSYHRFFTHQSSFPQFKKKYSYEAKVHLPQGFQIERVSKKYGRVWLPKMDEPLKFFWTDAIPKKPKVCILSMKNDEIYLSFTGMKYTNKIVGPETSIGVDVGVNVSVATSKSIDGERLHDIGTEEIKEIEEEIAELQRKQAHRVKFSRRWIRFQKKINKKFSHISNIRRDKHHKLTTKIAKNHGNIFHEALDIQKMTENTSGTLENPGKDVAKKTGLNRAIIRQGWGIHFRMLDYKNSWYSFGMVYKNPAYYSSQKCNRCKSIHEGNREKGTIYFQCLNCDYKVHADLNASDNHEEDGLTSLSRKDGWTHPTRKQNPAKRRWTKNRKKLRDIVSSNSLTKEQSGDSHKNKILSENLSPLGRGVGQVGWGAACCQINQNEDLPGLL